MILVASEHLAATTRHSMTHDLCVIICTRGRPNDLRTALASLEASDVPITQTIVSDDGPSDDTEQVAETAGFAVSYTIGPRRGLAANRNHALAQVSTPYVLFLDDDCRLAADFVARALACMESHERQFGPGAVVVSGAERKHDLMVEPLDQEFLGFQSKPYDRRVGINSIVINSTIFPTALAARLRFDHRLRFGSEEVDLATRMVAAGATIVYCPEAVNVHTPSPQGRSSHEVQSAASRLYATLKRYAFTERRPATACAFLLVAPFHLVASGLSPEHPLRFAESLRAVGTAGGYMLSFVCERSSMRVRRLLGARP